MLSPMYTRPYDVPSGQQIKQARCDQAGGVLLDQHDLDAHARQCAQLVASEHAKNTTYNAAGSAQAFVSVQRGQGAGVRMHIQVVCYELVQAAGRRTRCSRALPHLRLLSSSQALHARRHGK